MPSGFRSFSSPSTGEFAARFPQGRTGADFEELRERARSLSGLSLGELAQEGGLSVPPDLKRAKGWVGTLVEKALGATAGSRAEPDFPHLGIELKTLPVDVCGRPLESTFVCTIELRDIACSEWEHSRLLKKLSHVLWVPVLGERQMPVAERRIGTPLFWKPNEHEMSRLRADWEALALLISQGRTGEITGHLGEVLQVRPKAARGSSRRRALDDEGGSYDEQPKGFYLRTKFTRALLLANFSPTSL